MKPISIAAIRQVWSLLNQIAFSIIIATVMVFFYQSASNPFMGDSTRNFWVFAPDGKTHLYPASLEAADCAPFPVGRTLQLSRDTYALIYKEVDGLPGTPTDGMVWPLADDGSGARTLTKGIQNRISPSTMPCGPTAPRRGNYVFRVKFIISRPPLPPLIVRLKDVPVHFGTLPAGPARGTNP